jgi:predicted small lipoprotein YifL
MNMKRLIAVLITIIMALSLTACGETSAPAVVPDELPDVGDTLRGVPDEGDQPLQDEPTPVIITLPDVGDTLRGVPDEGDHTGSPLQDEGTPPRDESCPEWFIRYADVSVFGFLPHFDDPNTIPLSTFLSFSVDIGGLPFVWYSDEESERLFGEDRWYYGTSMMGYKPDEVDSFFKENFNPGFSIESYDYRSYDFRTNTKFADVTWDEEAGMLVWYIGISGGFPSYVNEIISMPEHNTYLVGSYMVDGYNYNEKLYDFYYVLENAPLTEINYNVYTFELNENGVINLLSKLPYEGEPPFEPDFSVMQINTSFGETAAVYNEFNAVNRTTAAHCIEFASGAAHLLFMLDMDYNNVMNWTAHDIYDEQTADIFNNKTLTSVLQFTVIERGRIADKDPLLDTVIAFAIFDDERYRVEMCFAPGGQYFDVMESVVSVFLAAS